MAKYDKSGKRIKPVETWEDFIKDVKKDSHKVNPKTLKNHEEKINDYIDYANELENDTTYTRHGMLLNDKRYKGKSESVITMIKNDNNLSNNQAHYFHYFMLQNGLTYDEAKEQLLSSKDFEEYDKRKKLREAYK